MKCYINQFMCKNK